MRIWISLIACFFSFELLAQNEAWNLKDEESGVIVYSRKIEGFKYKAVKTETLVKANIKDIEVFLKRVDLYPQWIAQCYSAELLSQPDPSRLYVYQQNKVAPGKDRDMIVQISFATRSDSSMVINQISKDTIVPLKEEIIRIPHFNAELTLTPMKDLTRFVYTIILDPGGDLPSFAVNKAIPKMFLETTINLKEMLEKGNIPPQPSSEKKEVGGRTED